MVDPGSQIALFISCGTFMGLVCTVILVNMAWRKQDATLRLLHNTEKAAVQTATLLESNVEIRTKLEEVRRHVNSTLTTVKQSEYDGMVRELILKQENIALKGGEPSQASIDYVELLRAKIKDRGLELADRSNEAIVLERHRIAAITPTVSDDT